MLSGDQDASPNQNPGLVASGASGTAALVVITEVGVEARTGGRVGVEIGVSVGDTGKVGVWVGTEVGSGKGVFEGITGVSTRTGSCEMQPAESIIKMVIDIAKRMWALLQFPLVTFTLLFIKHFSTVGRLSIATKFFFNYNASLLHQDVKAITGS